MNVPHPTILPAPRRCGAARPVLLALLLPALALAGCMDQPLPTAASALRPDI
jgi:hypothetical protein